MVFIVKIRLKVLCAERGISMSVISEKTGITPKTLSLLANGKVTGIRFSTLVKIKELLNCSFDDLFELMGS